MITQLESKVRRTVNSSDTGSRDDTRAFALIPNGDGIVKNYLQEAAVSISTTQDAGRYYISIGAGEVLFQGWQISIEAGKLEYDYTGASFFAIYLLVDLRNANAAKAYVCSVGINNGAVGDTNIISDIKTRLDVSAVDHSSDLMFEDTINFYKLYTFEKDSTTAVRTAPLITRTTAIDEIKARLDKLGFKKGTAADLTVETGVTCSLNYMIKIGIMVGVCLIFKGLTNQKSNSHLAKITNAEFLPHEVIGAYATVPLSFSSSGSGDFIESASAKPSKFIIDIDGTIRVTTINTSSAYITENTYVYFNYLTTDFDEDE